MKRLWSCNHVVRWGYLGKIDENEDEGTKHWALWNALFEGSSWGFINIIIVAVCLTGMICFDLNAMKGCFQEDAVIEEIVTDLDVTSEFVLVLLY